MSTPTLYGLPHCDSCKRARAWLTAQHIAHEFIDYRELPLAPAEILAAAEILGWERLINRNSTTWRQLEPARRLAQSADEWLALAMQYPTLLRRPLLRHAAHVDAGFVAARYESHFATGTTA